VHQNLSEFLELLIRSIKDDYKIDITHFLKNHLSHYFSIQFVKSVLPELMSYKSDTDTGFLESDDFVPLLSMILDFVADVEF
jgi:hypothetical protein